MAINTAYWPDQDVAITAGYTFYSDGVSEYTTGSGVTIDSLAIKDGGFPGQPDFAYAGAPFTVQNATVVSNLNADKLDGYDATDFSLAAHIHDDRYYTETEIDTALALYYTSAELDAGALDGRYYLESEIDALLASYLPLSGGTMTGALDMGGVNIDSASSVTSDEFIIGANTLDTNEWAFLDGQDQAVAIASTPTFGGLTLTGDLGMASYDITCDDITCAEITSTDGNIESGVDDTTFGSFVAYGNGAGSVYGGDFYLYTAASHDDAGVQYYRINVYEDDLRFDLSSTTKLTLLGEGTWLFGAAVAMGGNDITGGGNFYVNDGGAFGISGNERLVFNAAGTIVVTGALLDLEAASATAGHITQAGTRIMWTSAIQNSDYFGTSAGNTATTSAYRNLGVGHDSLDAITTGDDNVACGAWTLSALTVNSQNAAGGSKSMSGSTNADRNAAWGYKTLFVTSGDENAALGSECLTGVTSGTGNTGAGYLAGGSITTTNYGLFLGNKAGQHETAANKLFIDTLARTNEADGRVKALVYGVLAATTAAQYFTVNGHLKALEDLTIGTTVIDEVVAAKTVKVATELEIGDWPFAANYAVIGNTDLDLSVAGNYNILMQNNGALFLNAASGAAMHFRIANSVDKISINATTTTFAQQVLMATTTPLQFNTSAFHIASDGTDLTATSSGDFDVACPANKTLELQTAVWDDINFGSGQSQKPAASIPTATTFTDNAGGDTDIPTDGYAVGDKKGFTTELLHKAKTGADLKFHIHFQCDDAPTGNDYVKWQIDYTVTRDGATCAATTPIVVEVLVDTQYGQERGEFPAIDGSGFLVGDQVKAKLSRVVAAGAEYVGLAKIVTLGIHVEIDTMGSREEFVK